MIRNLFGGSKCRTIDVCDIFGDGSGRVLCRLDGNANDESGNYHGTETSLTYGGGVYERGGVFNGTTSRALLPYNIGTTIVSISVWFKGTTNGSKNQRIIDSASGNFAGMCSMVLNTVGQLAIIRGNNSTTEQFVAGAIGVGDNQWHHAVVVLNGNSVKTYIDGNLDINTTTSVALANDANFYIGTSSDLVNGLTGSIDQVRIFSKELTATEVATLYAECAPTSTVDNINPFEDSSLKALYQFNGDTTDKTNVYNGTATDVTWGTGKFGQCGLFNGSTSYVTTNYIPSLADFSISAWVKPTNYGNTYGICGTINSSGTDRKGFALSTTGTNGYLQATVYNSAGAVNIATTFVAPTTSFTNYTFTYIHSTGVFKIYGNGIYLATGTAIITGFQTDIKIGRYTGVADTANNFNGSIDQFRIFNKALTPMEVASLYTETTPMEEPLSALVDPFKDGSGKALYRLEGNALDESGNYNGTATSMVWASSVLAGRCADFTTSAPTMTFSRNIVTSLSSFSCSYWVYLTNVTSGAYIITTNSSSGNYFVTPCYVQAGYVYGMFGLSGTSQITTGTTSNPISINTWTFVTFIFNTDKTIQMSVNGGALSTKSSASSYNLSQINTDFNLFNSGVSDFTNGKIDQIRFFNRALTLSEIQTLYTKGA